MANFEISLAKPDFTFNASHFIAYRGYRERLHGHRYTVSLKLVGKVGTEASAAFYFYLLTLQFRIL
jgi:6-pyruvoyl-tetrahydropterin synthase